MTNLKFLAIRKCYGFEWESFKNSKSKNYIALCHRTSTSVEAETWEGLWEKILSESKKIRRSQRKKKR
jgi:hypothetical protein